MLDGLRLERDELWSDSPWVFSGAGNQILSFRKSWETACKASGFPDRLAHDLRRTGARNLVRSGVPEHVVMAIGGWKTRSVFQRYDTVDDADLGNAADALDRYLARQAQAAKTEVVN
jgi:integrase